MVEGEPVKVLEPPEAGVTVGVPDKSIRVSNSSSRKEDELISTL